MIERDDNIPPLETLLMELNLAREISHQVKQTGYDVDLVQKIQSGLAHKLSPGQEIPV